MQLSLKERIAYEMSFSLRERWNRAKEKAAQFIAWHCLPERVRMWVIIRRHADLTTGAGKFANQHPDTVSAFDLTKDMMK